MKPRPACASYLVNRQITKNGAQPGRCFMFVMGAQTEKVGSVKDRGIGAIGVYEHDEIRTMRSKIKLRENSRINSPLIE